MCDLDVYPDFGHLLPRNWANREDDCDPDPEARRNGKDTLRAFLKAPGLDRALIAPSSTVCRYRLDRPVLSTQPIRDQGAGT